MAGLYIHIPFCHSKCSYCDFYSGLRASAAEGYVDALLTELSLRRDETADDFSTIYIGGGTPSVLPTGEISRIAEAIGRLTDMKAVEEFTVEVNPEDVTEELLTAYRRIGINRISMGVQSFDDTLLKSINRRHTARQALEATRLLRAGNWNYSVDLMFGLPGQTLSAWQNDVNRIMQINPPHMSAYLLSCEPGTRLYAMLQTGKVTETPEQLASEMQQYVTDAARAHGYNHYEISNYAQPGFHSRHNSAYWTMTPYLGLGASAHSYDGNVRRINPANIKKYMASLSKGVAIAECEDETLDEIFNDYIIAGLRTADGLSIEALRQRFPEHYISDLLADAAPFINGGELVVDSSLAIPECHWLKADAIMRDLLRV